MNNILSVFFLSLLILLSFVSCKPEKKHTISTDLKQKSFSVSPNERKEVKQFPKKENLWMYVMAGQSNMAGRGIIKSTDTLPNRRILSMGADLKWHYAQEPLHFYEPKRAGLDCGKSFSEELLKHIPDSISIGLIPCAVGGSSIDNWLSDAEFRNVKLLSNFSERVKIGKKAGVIKGILWHQGESDTQETSIPAYKNKLIQLHQKFRSIVENDSLPIIVGPITYFGNPGNTEKSFRWEQINRSIETYATENNEVYLIKTDDFLHKGDSLHYDAASQRRMGKRFAEKILQVYFP